MILSNNYWTDPRVKKEVEYLMEKNHDIKVVHWNRKKSIIPLPLRHILWQIKTYRHVKNKKYDVVHCHDFDTLRIGVKLKKRNNCKLIYDSHEMWSYMVKDYHPLISRISDYLERKYLNHVDHVITVDSGTTKYIYQRTDKPVTQIENCKNIISKKYVEPKNKTFTISYFGTLDNQRMFPQIIDIIGKMNDVRFIVGGQGVAKKWVEFKSKKYDNVTFLGMVSETEMMKHMQESDAVICMFDPNNLNKRYGIPNKFYESLVCGRPLICTVSTNLGYLVSKYNCGMFAVYSKNGVEQTISFLKNYPKQCKKLGENGLQLAIDKYNWESEKQKLLEIYK